MSYPKLTLALAPLAERDLRDILQYTLETWGENQMQEYAAALAGAIERLQETPAWGASGKTYTAIAVSTGPRSM